MTAEQPKSDEGNYKVTIKMLPWVCGNCGKKAVQNLRVQKENPKAFIATCDECGTQWTT